MLFLKIFLASGFLLGGLSPSWGLMPAGKKPVESVKMEEARKPGAMKKAAPLVGSVRRSTEFVRKIEAGILYTEGNRYSLSGVKVMDFTGGRNPAQPGKLTKKTAEMTFIHGQLREVVIRQRR
jgi:hypothetical protein